MVEEKTTFATLELSDVALTDQATLSKLQNEDITIDTLYQFITTRNTNLYKLSYRIITYFLIIQPLMFAAYMMDYLSPDNTLFIMAIAALLPVLLQIKLRLNTGESISKFVYNYGKIDTDVRRFKRLQITLSLLTFVGLAVGVLLLEKMTTEVFIVGFLMLTTTALVERVTNKEICKFDIHTRELIENNNLSNPNNILVIDEFSNVYEVKGLIYTHRDTILGTISYTDDPLPVDGPDKFNPDIDHSTLEQDETIVTWESYVNDIIGNPLDSEQEVQIVATKVTVEENETQNKESIIEVLLQQPNPYNLSADDLERLSEEDLCKEYFRKLERKD